MKQRTQEAPLTRNEKLLRRTLPAAAIGALVLTAVGVGVNTLNTHNRAEEIKADTTAEALYVSNLESVALNQADPNNVIGAPMTDNGESARIYDQAMAQLESLGLNDKAGLNAVTVGITSTAISRANLIQPDSIFVLTQGDFDNNGTIDVIVQPAPEDLVKDD